MFSPEAGPSRYGPHTCTLLERGRPAAGPQHFGGETGGRQRGDIGETEGRQRHLGGETKGRQHQPRRGDREETARRPKHIIGETAGRQRGDSSKSEGRHTLQRKI